MTDSQSHNQRNVGLDLLRIISMLLIILLHSVDHSGVLEAAPNAGPRTEYYVRFIYMLCQICVNCYVMLSGYFLVKSHFRLQKLAALWLETAFYSFTIKAAFMLLGEISFSAVSLISCFVPILTGRYWFITIYVGLYALSPFLNTAVRAMDKRTHAMLVLTLALLFSAWNSLHPAFAGMNSGGGWGLAWFVVLYLTAAWIRLYGAPVRKPSRYALLWMLLSAASAAVYCFIGGRFSLARAVAGQWYHYNSLPAYVSTVAVFLCFLGVNVKNARTARIITSVAPSTLGVYLIHAHANLSPLIWEKLDLPSYVGRPDFPLIQFVIVLAMFVVCVIVDMVRRETIGSIENSRFVYTACRRTEDYFQKQFDKVMARLTDE